MNVKPIKTRVFKEGEDLEAFIARYVKKLPEKSILVVTSKIVALAEGRTADPKDRERIIKEESDFAMKTKITWLTIKDGFVMMSSGVDESNAAGKLILLPKDSMKVARELRKKLQKRYKIKKLGILLSDSRTFPLRAGVSAVALGYAGFKGIRDYRGTKDMFGRLMIMSRVNVADALATAAVLEMGEGKEQQPLALITGATVEFTDRVKKDELKIALEDDVYRPLFERLKDR